MFNFLKNKKNKNILVFLIFNCLLLSSLIAFGGQHYSVDSYGSLKEGMGNGWAWQFGQYSFLGGIVDIFLGFIGYNPIVNATPAVILFIVILSVCASLFAHKLSEAFNSSDNLFIVCADLLFILSFANIWACNYLSFPECIVTVALSIIPITATLIYFLKLKSFKDYLLCTILLTISILCSRVSLTIFVIYVIGIIGARLVTNKENSIKIILLSYIKPAIIAICSTGVFFVIGTFINKLCGVQLNSRVSLSVDTFFNSLVYYLKHAHSYLKGRIFYSSELLTVCYLIIGTIWFISVIYFSVKNRKIWLGISLLVTAVIGYLSAHATVLFAETHTFRGLYGLFSLFFLFLIEIYAFTNRKVFKFISIIIVSIALLSGLYISVNYAVGQKVANFADKTYSNLLVESINDYETQTGKKIKKLSYCIDTDKEYGGEIYENDIESTGYSVVGIFKDLTDRTYEIVDMPNNIKSDFNGKNWSAWNYDEQLIFNDDTLYFCVY